ncbi:MAG: carboxypeptidase regulatory-like domain-containing protein [Bacteroidales bacterium]|nr:carboxypeptidase regulatory-like domain-containing protein [Bacteroidales bacterium]
MKKILLLSALAVAGLTAGAKTADELRVYINPGHGSWTANDRPNAIVGHAAYSRTNTDTTNFFETNTNLRKGFGVLERLRQYGLKFDPTKNQEGERWQIGAARDMENNIVMSHVKCGPYHEDNGTVSQLGDAAPKDIYYYNRDLTEIDKEVDANNFDMFISIHSNAATEGTTTNYPLFLYRGYDTPSADEYNTNGDVLILSNEHQVESRKMADMCWGYAIENPFMVWSAYNNGTKNLRGDISFYGSGSTSSATFCKGYLGVLKHHVPGFLVEGYFHTYQPARHRAMNWDVDYVEGYAYAHGIADYFGLEKEKTGVIYGIVRDLHEKFTHEYYKPSPISNDVYLPINGCKVILKQGDKVVAEKTTDNNYNGAYVFDNVEPGKYTLVFEHPQYKEIEPVEVEVKAAANTYPEVQLENVDYVPPTKVYVDYPDPAAEMQGVMPADEYVVADVYTDEPIKELEGKIVRRAIVQEGKMYILAIDKLPVYAQVVEDKPVPTILVYDLNEKKVLANVSTEGATGSIQNISDIQVSADGILLASNQTKTQYSNDYLENLPDGSKEPRGTFTLYKWENDENGIPTGNPAAWLTTQQSGRWYRAYAGGTVAYAGTTEDGKLFIPMPSVTAPNHVFRWTVLTVANGEHAGSADILGHAKMDGETDFVAPGEIHMGEGYRFVTSPLNTENFYTFGPLYGAGERKFVMADNERELTIGNEEFAGIPGTVGAFKYAGADYIVAPESKDGENIGLRLIDITNNIDAATGTPITGTSITGLETENVATAGEVEAVYDDLNNVYTAAWLNLYVLRDGKISKMTTKDVKQPVNKTEFAYGLKATKNDDDTYTIEYALTGDAVSAELVLTEPREAIAFPLEATKGAHSFTLNTAELNDGIPYTWEVKVTSKSNAQSGEIFAEKHGLSDRRGGVVPITDPAAESFGYTVVSHGNAGGMDIYNPAGEKVGERLWKDHALFGGANGANNQSNPFRGHERDGKVVLPSWGDKAHGIVAIDPLAAEEPAGMYSGEMQSSGNFIYNEASLGGGHAGLCFVGKGEDTKLFAFSEDHDASKATANSVVRYNIGNAWVITEAPEVMGHKSLLANTNVDMLGYGEGYFVSQCRGAGNNTTGCPCFAYIDANSNEVVYQSSENADDITSGISGIAITNDGKILAHAETNKIDIFNVKWNGNKPTLTLSSTIPFGKTLAWAHMRFDAAGNLHVYERENGGYHVYAVARKSPAVSTQGISEIIGSGEAEGVDNIDEDLNNGPVEFWNLQGVKVNSENLTPGIYIRRQGQKAEKVVIR